MLHYFLFSLFFFKFTILIHQYNKRCTQIYLNCAFDFILEYEVIVFQSNAKRELEGNDHRCNKTLRFQTDKPEFKIH